MMCGNVLNRISATGMARNYVGRNNTKYYIPLGGEVPVESGEPGIQSGTTSEGEGRSGPFV